MWRGQENISNSKGQNVILSVCTSIGYPTFFSSMGDAVYTFK